MTTQEEIVTGAETAVKVIQLLQPLVLVGAPGLAAALEIAARVIQGAADNVPTAVALYDRIKSGNVPTAGELAQYWTEYEAAYGKLDADIKAKLAQMP